MSALSDGRRREIEAWAAVDGNERGVIATWALLAIRDLLLDGAAVRAERDEARKRADYEHRQTTELLVSYAEQVTEADTLRAQLAAAHAALRGLMLPDGHAPGCPGERFHDRPEHDCLAIRKCVAARAALSTPEGM